VILWYTVSVKNITVAVPDDVYRQARIQAAHRGTSVSGLVGEYLRSIGSVELEFIRLEQEQKRVQGEITRFRAAERLGRDRVHERALR
jgi:hypothetical protein